MFLSGLGVLSFVLQAESVPWIHMPKFLWVQVTVSLLPFKTQLEEAARVPDLHRCLTDLFLA